MLSSFFEGVANLTHQNFLFVGFLALIAGGAFIGTKKLTENRSPYFMLVGIWFALAFLVGITRDIGGMSQIFLNPITVGLLGAIFGGSYTLQASISAD
jgi:hypothetical protein